MKKIAIVGSRIGVPFISAQQMVKSAVTAAKAVDELSITLDRLENNSFREPGGSKFHK